MAMYGGVSIRRNGGFLGPVQLLRVASLLSQDGQRALEVTLTNTALLSNIIIQGKQDIGVALLCFLFDNQRCLYW